MTSCYFPPINCSAFPVKVRPASPIGIVIHFLQEDYSEIVNDQLFLSNQLSNYEDSVGYHYTVSNTGIVNQLIDPVIQVPNFIDYTNATWINKPVSGAGSVDPDEILIHIALTNINLPCNSFTALQNQQLVRLICCLIHQFNATISSDTGHIFLPPAIDANQTDYYDGSSLDSDIFTDIAACLAGSFDEGEDISPGCCATNTEAIAALALRMTSVEGGLDAVSDSVVALGARIDILEEWYEDVAPTLSDQVTKYDAFVETIQGIRVYLASIKACLDAVCPANTTCGVIEYTLSQIQDFQIVNPNINRWINFATKVSDLLPAVVRTGPLWDANLPAGTYELVVTARLSSSDYANGSKAWLELVQCGVKTRIAEVTLSAGTQTVEISSDDDATAGWTSADKQVIIISACPDFHIEIGTDDVSSSPAYKTLENASIVITPLLA